MFNECIVIMDERLAGRNVSKSVPTASRKLCDNVQVRYGTRRRADAVVAQVNAVSITIGCLLHLDHHLVERSRL